MGPEPVLGEIYFNGQDQNRDRVNYRNNGKSKRTYTNFNKHMLMFITKLYKMPHNWLINESFTQFGPLPVRDTGPRSSCQTGIITAKWSRTHPPPPPGRYHRVCNRGHPNHLPAWSGQYLPTSHPVSQVARLLLEMASDHHRAEAVRLKSQGVDILIALGHAGYK